MPTGCCHRFSRGRDTTAPRGRAVCRIRTLAPANSETAPELGHHPPAYRNNQEARMKRAKREQRFRAGLHPAGAPCFSQSALPLHTGEVIGSTPIAPTIKSPQNPAISKRGNSPVRQLTTEQSKKTTPLPVENPWTLFTVCHLWSLSNPLSLPQIKSEHTDDAIRRERTERGCVRLGEQGAGSGRPCPAIDVCAPRYSSPCKTATDGADGARRTRRHGRDIPGGSSRSGAPHNRSAKASTLRSDDREYPETEPDEH